MKFKSVLFVVIVLVLSCLLSCEVESPSPEDKNVTPQEQAAAGYGKIAYRGSFDRAPDNAERYDVYYNITDGNLYIYDGSQWTLLAIKGDKGDTGATGAQGEKGDKGETGAQGLDGKSIIWKGSYSSSEELTNPQELWAYYNTTKGSSYIYTNGSWTLLAKSGTSISWKGAYSAAPSNPSLYDAYYNTSDGCSYIYDGSQWVLLASKGAKGDTGAVGVKGDTGAQGAKGDKGDDGLDGQSIVWKGSLSQAPSSPSDFWAYYSTSTGCSYIYMNGSWNLLASSGASITWKGSFDTAPTSPSLYDAYYNTTDGCSYIYDGTQWTLLASKGAKGDKGDTGATGAKGDTGAQGVAGVDGRSIEWKGTFSSHPANPEELWTYYNSTDGNAYIYSNGSWQLLIENLAVNYDTPTIIGTVIANGDNYSVADTYVKVVDETTKETVWNNKPAQDGDFAVSALDASKTYTIYFTSNRLSDVNITRTRTLSSDFSGTFGAIRTGVSPLSGKAKDVGDIILTPNGKITGKVTLSDGSTPAGIDVYLNNTSYATTTSSDGSYVLSDIVQGTYVIVFSKDGYSPVSKEVIVYSSDLSTDPSLSMSDVNLVVGTSSISGTVSFSDKSDATGINLILINSDGVTVKAVNTAADGKFSFTSINPGIYTVRASADGYVSVDKAITITEGESYVLPLGSLVNLCGTINGKVTTSDSITGSDTKVSAVNADGRHSYEVSTSTDGTYTITGAYNGKYTLTFTKNEYLAGSTEVTLDAGASAMSNIELKSKYGFITVTVGYADKTSPAGIIVSVYKGSTLISASKATDVGTVTVSKLEPGSDYRVVASCENYSSTEVDDVSITSGVYTTINLEKLSNNYGSVSGTVVDVSGSPVAAATISMTRTDGNSYTLITDNDGKFSKTDIAIGTYTVSVVKEGFNVTTLSSTYTVESAKETKITDSIVLKSKYASINGKVLYADKTDQSNISVTIENSKGIIESVTTGKDGAFSFSVEAGTYTIRANASDYNESVKEISVVASTSYSPTLESLTSKYGTITGKVVDTNLSPIEGATVLITGDGGSSYSDLTLSDGSFTRRVPVGSYSISVSRRDYKTAILPLKYAVSSSKTTTVDDAVLTGDYAIINGKVSCADSATPSNVFVVLSSDGTTVDTATTSSDGSFIFRVGDGTYTVTADKDGYNTITKSYTVVSGRSYSLDLGALKCTYGTLKGKVVDSSGSAVTGAVITVTNMDGSVSPYTLSTDADGVFTSSTILVGTYTVSITKSGYVDITISSVPVVGGSIYDVGTKTMVPGAAGITGRVILEGVSSYSGVTVTATSVSDSTKVFTTSSSDDGSYYFVSIPSGTYSIKLQKEGFLSDLTQQVSLSSGEISSVRTVTLKNESSTLTGTAVLAGGADFTGIQVLVKDTASTTTFSTTTDRNGKYTINNVTTGTYELIFSRTDYGSVTVSDVQIGKGEVKTVDSVSLEIAYTSVKGKITLEEATDYSGTLITATSLSNTEVIYSAITNSDGNFTLAKMCAGEYSIVVSRNNYLSATLQTVTVKDDTPIDCGTTNLEIAKGEITGIARLEGYSDYSGIKVTLLGTDKTATTAKDGSYTFTVPAGNYSGGLRFEYEDFETTSYAANITVLQTTTYSDAYVVPDVKLTCLNVPKISGKVTIYGLTKAQYQDITITIAELPQFTYTTGEDGTYYFEHVPVGTYTFEFTRENARKVTKIVAVEAAPEIKIENIELIPDAVTLYGNISLTGVADYSGVTVRITTPDSVELKTVTNAAGNWYISNIVASKSHTITFEKTGWESQSFNIAADAYVPLSETDYNAAYPVALVDKVAPVITSFTATVGKSTEDGREIYLYLYTKEEGSGVKYIQGNTSCSLDGVDEQEYYNPFKLIIPDEVGAKTIYVRVKDAAENVSNTVSTNVVLKNDKTELSSVLSGEKLTLKATDDNGEHIVYLMTDNVLVPSGSTLTIEPGVEIQVNGAYYIQVEGTLNAVGKADDKIKIYGVDDGADKWLGFKILNDNGSKITYAEITGLTQGVQGYCDIDNSTITAASAGYVLGYYYDVPNFDDVREFFYGSVTKSKISGYIYANPLHIISNIISSNCIELTTSIGSIFDNEFVDIMSGQIYGPIIQSTFSGTGTLTFSSVYMMNNEVNVSNVKITDSIVKYTTFNNSSLSLSGGSWSYNTLNNCIFSSYSVYRFTNSNFIGCGNITVTLERSTQEFLNMKNNFWGDNTVFLEKTTEDNKNVTFIHDYYDDFTLSQIIWDDYSTTAITDCGYLEAGRGTTEEYTGYSIGDSGPAGGIVFYDKGYYSDGWRYMEAATTDLGTYVFGYYRPSGDKVNGVGTSTAVGAGKDNTNYLVEAMDIEEKAYSSSSGTTTAEYAVRKCYDYASRGCTDWFLPSKDELNLMYTNLYKKGLSSFYNSWYWSSSEESSSKAWYQLFGSEYHPYDTARDSKFNMRPIRTF